jgi:hypothetical protein
MGVRTAMKRSFRKVDAAVAEREDYQSGARAMFRIRLEIDIPENSGSGRIDLLRSDCPSDLRHTIDWTVGRVALGVGRSGTGDLRSFLRRLDLRVGNRLLQNQNESDLDFLKRLDGLSTNENGVELPNGLRRRRSENRFACHHRQAQCLSVVSN